MKNPLNILKKEISGVAALEFAILLPLLLLLFFGSFEVSRYIVITRKADNVANDIAYVLSREGDIHNADRDLRPGELGEDAARLTSLIQSLVPMILYPYENENYEIDVRFIGLPINDNPAHDPDSLRVMWAHCDKKFGSDRFLGDCSSDDGVQTSTEDFEIDNSTQTINGTTYDTSTYSDKFGERAKIILRGQSFILVNFNFGYDQILDNFTQFGGIDFSNFSVEKVSTYAVRSRWDDKNGNDKMESDEFLNDMHICIDCNLLDSDRLSGGTGRQQCEPGAVISTIDAGKTSGCKFD